MVAAKSGPAGYLATAKCSQIPVSGTPALLTSVWEHKMQEVTSTPEACTRGCPRNEVTPCAARIATLLWLLPLSK